MRVLIVGCGYLGLPLGTQLAQQGHTVCGLRRSWPDPALPRRLGVQPLTADLTEPARLRVLEPAFDWVVNCAASGGGDADDYRRLYLEGTRHLLAWLAGAPLQRFVYTSSTGVYGQDDGSEVLETSHTEPAAPTAHILVQTEQLLLGSFRERGFPAIILRLAGLYGPHRGYWLRQYLAGTARLEGDGSRYLNLIHRDDAIRAVIAALERGKPGQIYNVADDAPVTQRTLFDWLAAATGRPLPPASPSQAVPARKRGATNKRVSNRRLRQELACALQYPTFREGFQAELQSLLPSRDFSAGTPDERPKPIPPSL